MARVIVEEATLTGLGITASAMARKSYGFTPQSEFVGLGELFTHRIYEPFSPQPNYESGNPLAGLGEFSSARNRQRFLTLQAKAPIPPLSTRGDYITVAGPTLATGPGALERAIVRRAAGPTSGLPGLRPTDSQAATTEIGSAANVAYRLGALREAKKAAKLAPTMNVVNRKVPAPPPGVQLARSGASAAGTIGSLFDAMRRELNAARADHRAAQKAQKRGEVGKANALMSRANERVEAAKLLVQQMVKAKGDLTRDQIRVGAGMAIKRANASGNPKLANEIASTIRRFNETKLPFSPQGDLVSRSIDPEGQTELPPHIQVGVEDDMPGSLYRNAGFGGLGGLSDVPGSGFFDKILANVESGAKKAVASVSPSLKKQVCRAAVAGGKSAIQTATTKLNGLGRTASQQARMSYGFEPQSDFVGMDGLHAFTPEQKKAAVAAGAGAAEAFVTDAAKGACPVGQTLVTGEGITSAAGGGFFGVPTTVLVGGTLLAGVAAWKFGLLRRFGIG